MNVVNALLKFKSQISSYMYKRITEVRIHWFVSKTALLLLTIGSIAPDFNIILLSVFDRIIFEHIESVLFPQVILSKRLISLVYIIWKQK